MMRGSIRGVLIDLSGTVHVDNRLIEGSCEALLKLRQNGIRYRFVTNTTKESVGRLHQRLKDFNLDVKKEEIFTSLIAARKLLQDKNLHPHLMLSDDALQDFPSLPTSGDVDAVVVGLSPRHFDFQQMNIALRYLLNGAQLIAINKARYIMTKDGFSHGAGGFVAALEYASGKEATIVGKPNPQFFQAALQLFNLPAADCVMIGDDVRDDVIGAVDAGLHGILVKTGKYRQGDEQHCTHVADNLNQAVDLVLEGKISS